MIKLVQYIENNSGDGLELAVNAALEVEGVEAASGPTVRVEHIRAFSEDEQRDVWTHLPYFVQAVMSIPSEQITEVLALATDGYVECRDADYATARDGLGARLTSAVITTLPVGQELAVGPLQKVFQAFLNFDVSGITGPVLSAELSLFISFIGVTEGFSIQARARNWGDALEAADFIPGDDLAGSTLLAEEASVSFVDDAFLPLVNNGTELRDAINAARLGDGILRLILCSSQTVDAVETSLIDRVTISSRNHADGGQHPKLNVTWLS